MSLKLLRLVFILLFMNSLFIGYSQLSFGVGLGYTNNHLYTDISNRVYTENKTGSGIGTSILLETHLCNRINFHSGIYILQKSYNFVRTGNYTSIYENHKNTYLQLPIIIKLSLLRREKVQFFINGGLFVSYWAFGKVKGITPNVFNSVDSLSNNGQPKHYLNLTSYSEKYLFNSLRDNRFEFGLLGGISIYYNYNRRYKCFFDCYFYQSLSDQQKKYMINQIPRYNQTLFFSIGYMKSLSFKYLK